MQKAQEIINNESHFIQNGILEFKCKKEVIKKEHSIACAWIPWSPLSSQIYEELTSESVLGGTWVAPHPQIFASSFLVGGCSVQTSPAGGNVSL